ncbi:MULTISPECIES: Na+/H+ antiporter NhaC family protein [unclassified Streptomyces]|uniref:YfcC family protein n=1 Tax=unclassified Streptomyces TaxID=2593676 RepID=UPI000DBA215B|nr:MULTISPECIES: Na+/H+ antiporter NhaC family protein [unclassified Streptomyces]MYT70422.1 YfcC family protein [Streptomyces sp. SID8367]RAJ90120.1 putative ion transporter superfamily protein YfcC [Streptomyces sp. PsTaAH-137]
MSTETAPPPETSQPDKKRKFTFPSALTVLAVVTIAVWLLAFLIPSGQYDRNDAGAPVEGTYHRVPSGQSFVDRLNDLFLSPVNGLYGIQDAKTSLVGPDNSGDLYGSAGVFLFVLAIGAFITVVFATGALDRGIGLLAHRLRSRGALLIAGVMVVFSVLGTVEGFAEETLGFYGLIVPLMLALGYDRMTAVGAIILGAGVGVLCSTVNPFATGVASSAADISLGDGIVLRFVMWVVLTAVTVAYVIRYARRVQKNPERSLSGFLPGDRETSAAAEAEVPELTRLHQAVLVVTALVFAFMIFSVVPWASALTGDADATPYGFELGWSFPQLAALFLCAAVLVGLVARMGEQKISSTIIQGAADFVSPALVILLARGVTVIMNNSKITDTVLHAIEGVVKGTSSGIFAIIVFVVNLPLAFLIPSTSGHATLAMPILAPLADFAGVSRAVVVTAWEAASGWMNLWVPTTAVTIGGVALAKVGYDRYLRFVWPLLALLFILICAFVALGAAFT